MTHTMRYIPKVYHYPHTMGDEIPMPCHAPMLVIGQPLFFPNGIIFGRGNNRKVNPRYLSHTSHKYNATSPSSNCPSRDQGREGICSWRKYPLIMHYRPWWNKLMQFIQHLAHHNLTYIKFNPCTSCEMEKGYQWLRLKPPNSRFNLNLSLESRWNGLTLVKILWKKND